MKGVNSSATGNTVGVWGVASASPTGTGVAGAGGAVGGYFTSNTASSGDYAGVYGVGSANPGVKGLSSGHDGVYGQGSIAGVEGKGTQYGVLGTSGGGFGVYGTYGAGLIPPSGTNAGVYGNTLSSNSASAGVRGEGTNNYGVEGVSVSGAGVFGHSTSAPGMSAVSVNSYGCLAISNTSSAVRAISSTAEGVWGTTSAAGSYGGYFQNTGGGAALYSNGLAQVKTLQILGADLAESFPVKESAIEPGTVVMIDGGADGALRVCDEAYSSRVAGVVSGANGLDAAVILSGHSFDRAGRASVAMSGRVWVKCDAANGAIRPGDLLTTAVRAGHAMRATDRDRAYGATIGKAMTSLETGTGLVLVLVSLQ